MTEQPIEFEDAVNIVSCSMGKDSTATLLIALNVLDVPNLRFVFADTGNEHPETLAYKSYLESEFGIEIETIKADFSAKIVKRQAWIREKWVEEGIVTAEEAEAVCGLLVPTGNPFLDLCIWKGRFPSRRAQFCTQFLKAEPIHDQVMQPLIDAGKEVISWQGVRRDESEARKNSTMWEEKDHHFIYRPIVEWTAQQAIDFHAEHGIKPNPLYSQGMTRVGCMPCINVSKAELREIGTRFPEEIARISAWEQIVGMVAKRRNSTFFHARTDPMVKTKDNDLISTDTHGIMQIVEWSKTARGGRQFDLLGSMDAPMCSSSYGLCE